MENYNFTNLDFNNYEKLKKKKGLNFIEEKHQYFLNGEKVFSVSQLLKDGQISSNYDNVNEEILERARLRGNAIHLQVKEALKYNNFQDMEEEAFQIVDYIKDKAKERCIITEEAIFSENKIKPYCGRFDILIENKKGEIELYDIKTNKTWSSHNSYAATWQLSLYAKAIEEKLGKVHKIAVLRFSKDKKLIVENLTRIKDNNINELLENGKMRSPLVPLAKGEIDTLVNILRKEKELKELEEQIKDVKANIYNFMKENQILKAATLDKRLFISFVGSSKAESLDLERLKKENPEIYEKYKIIKERKGFLRIKTLKEREDV